MDRCFSQCVWDFGVYEEYYQATNKQSPQNFIANPTSTIIAGSSLETSNEETESQHTMDGNKFNPDRVAVGSYK